MIKRVQRKVQLSSLVATKNLFELHVHVHDNYLALPQACAQSQNLSSGPKPLVDIFPSPIGL